MAYHSISESDNVQFLVDFQSGTDDPIYWSSPNRYNRSIVRGAKAEIVYINEASVNFGTAGGGWRVVNHTNTVLWPAYSLESKGQNDRMWMDSCGLQLAEAANILDMRLIKRIQGNSVDPTMFLAELDRNFSTVTKRVSQAARFIDNLKNPKELARLTLRYFKGSETRRSLTGRYARARRQFQRRAKRWKTKDWSSTYLEYQFGWRPMCEDVWNLIGLAREAKIKAAQQFARVGLSPVEYRGSRNNAGPIGRSSDVAYCDTLTAGHAKITFEITHPWLRQGASLESPAYATWDSIPYSWLADCVTNVGDHLKYLMYDAGLGFNSGYRSLLRTVVGHVTIDPSVTREGDRSSARTFQYFISGGRLSYSGVQCQRHVYTEFPAVPWFNKVKNTMKNAGLLSTIGAYIHQRLAGYVDFKRPWKTSSP